MKETCDLQKFRVWDNEKKEYSTEWFVLSMEGELNIVIGRGLQKADPKRYIVEQCISRKDKNGALIYKGDIVKTIWNESVKWTGRIEPVEHFFEIYYNGMGFSMKELKTQTGHVMWKSEDYEVIGNIHEVWK